MTGYPPSNDILVTLTLNPSRLTIIISPTAVRSASKTGTSARDTAVSLFQIAYQTPLKRHEHFNLLEGLQKENKGDVSFTWWF